MQETQEMGIWSLCQEDPLEKGMATLPSILASQGQRSLVGCSPWGSKETRLKQLTMHMHIYINHPFLDELFVGIFYIALLVY